MRKSTGKNTCPDAPDAPDASDRGLHPGEPPPAQPARPSQRAAPPAPIQLAATGRQREVAAAKLHFEALEPRILLDGDPAAGVMTLAGSIDVPGEQDYYRFTVDEASRVVLDSLSNCSDLSWRLDGPGGLVGERSFSATDSPYSSPPAYDLTPGQYQLRVDGAQDALGAYSLRVIDAASASVIAPDTPVSGVLELGNQSAAYRFRASAGDSYAFKATTPASAALFGRLLDPFGRQEGVSFDARHDGARGWNSAFGELI